jgi:hypothetical protein
MNTINTIFPQCLASRRCLRVFQQNCPPGDLNGRNWRWQKQTHQHGHAWYNAVFGVALCNQTTQQTLPYVMGFFKQHLCAMAFVQAVVLMMLCGPGSSHCAHRSKLFEQRGHHGMRRLLLSPRRKRLLWSSCTHLLLARRHRKALKRLECEMIRTASHLHEVDRKEGPRVRRQAPLGGMADASILGPTPNE